MLTLYKAHCGDSTGFSLPTFDIICLSFITIFSFVFSPLFLSPWLRILLHYKTFLITTFSNFCLFENVCFILQNIEVFSSFLPFKLRTLRHDTFATSFFPTDINIPFCRERNLWQLSSLWTLNLASPNEKINASCCRERKFVSPSPPTQFSTSPNLASRQYSQTQYFL